MNKLFRLPESLLMNFIDAKRQEEKMKSGISI
jgi:hypothetical protein